MLLQICVQVLGGKIGELRNRLTNCTEVETFDIDETGKTAFVDIQVRLPRKDDENTFLHQVVAPAISFRITGRTFA